MTADPDDRRAAIARRLDEEVDRLVTARHEAIETACEVALVGGVAGVAVYDDAAVVDPAVPYGTMHVYPGRFAEWVDR